MTTQRPHSLLTLLLFVCLTARIQACFREENNTSTIGGTTAIASRLLETGSAYNLVMEVPGVKPRDLDISVDYDERRLVVSGAIRDKAAVVVLPPERDELVESYYQSYLVIDDKVNLYDLTMAFTDGTVTVSVPKPVSFVKRKKTKIRGASTSSKAEDDSMLAQQKHEIELMTARSPSPTKQLNYYHEAPRVQPTISAVHAPRIAEMSEVDEEFQYWNHLI